MAPASSPRGSAPSGGYKQMIVRVHGAGHRLLILVHQVIHGNYRKSPSVQGRPDNLPSADKTAMNFSRAPKYGKTSGAQGRASARWTTPPTAVLVERLQAEYLIAVAAAQWQRLCNGSIHYSRSSFIESQIR